MVINVFFFFFNGDLMVINGCFYGDLMVIRESPMGKPLENGG